MKDKVVVITGGSSGIGRALAETFGKQGSKIFITGRNAEELEKTVTDLRKENIDIHSLQADVSKEEDNVKMAQEAVKVFGKIDILINNAGISMRALFEEVDIKVVKKVMDINFYGVLYATQACLPEIMKNSGSIVGISSIAGYRGLPGRILRQSSSFLPGGVIHLVRCHLLLRLICECYSQ